jgi:hypothetical protein
MDDAAKPRLDEAASRLRATTTPASATEQASAAVVTISRQGASQAAETEAAPAETRPAAAKAAETTPKSNKPDLAYEAADTDKDSKISAYEQQSYGFRHPDLRAYTALAQDGNAGQHASTTDAIA